MKFNLGLEIKSKSAVVAPIKHQDYSELDNSKDSESSLSSHKSSIKSSHKSSIKSSKKSSLKSSHSSSIKNVSSHKRLQSSDNTTNPIDYSFMPVKLEEK